jgi:membrane associated rhomboid family serine protease
VIPLKDDVPSRTLPLITVAILLANVAAHLYQMSLEAASAPVSPRVLETLSCLRLDARVAESHPALALVCEFGAIPCRLTGACASPADFAAPAVTVFTSMFLHGGLLHLGGNMLYLWIFGNNVEDTLGHGRFLLFYLVAGVAAVAAQAVPDPASTVPMVGASGAVAGVLGAYLLLFPRATILTLMVFGFFVRLVRLPALVVLGLWILLQLFQSYLSLGGGEGGGVAWFAHVGGFAAGMALLFVLRPRRRARL